MSIPSNQYRQFHDYLTKLLGLSGKGELPKINQGTIATKLHVDDSGVCRFLGGSTSSPKKMMTNFKVTYPLEFRKWPEGLDTINRALVESDGWYFLDLKAPARKARIKPDPLEDSPKKSAVQIAPIPRNLVLKAIPSRTPDAPTPKPKVEQPLAGPSQPPGPAPLQVRTPKMPKAPIAISYRGHQSDKDAGGMLFDHIRFQEVTNFPTRALLSREKEPQRKTMSLFLSALKGHPARLPYGVENHKKIQHPPFVASSAKFGLLVIPGRVHNIEDEPVRLEHEYRVIRKALNRGQPILGICAGSWRLCEQIAIWTKEPSRLSENPSRLARWHEVNQTLEEAKDHGYGGGMIRLDRKMGIKTTYNVQIHDVEFEEDSWVKASMKTKAIRLSVNSVHWKAVNPEKLPLNMKVSGWSVENPSIQIETRQQEIMHPQKNLVEAFENVHGSPIAGIQWHPEGYNHDDKNGGCHRRLLKYMALAGSAYAAKRRMLQELPKCIF